MTPFKEKELIVELRKMVKRLNEMLESRMTLDEISKRTYQLRSRDNFFIYMAKETFMHEGEIHPKLKGYPTKLQSYYYELFNIPAKGAIKVPKYDISVELGVAFLNEREFVTTLEGGSKFKVVNQWVD
jgi:hypothetical protein